LALIALFLSLSTRGTLKFIQLNAFWCCRWRWWKDAANIGPVKATLRCCYGDDAPLLQFGAKQKARAITIANPESGSQGYVYSNQSFFESNGNLQEAKGAVALGKKIKLFGQLIAW
jgi:hypothetical protein